MEPSVKTEILNVLQQAITIIKANNMYALRPLSDHVIKSATVFQDKDVISIAVLIYSLSKVYKEKAEPFVIAHLEDALKALEKNDMNGYESEIKHLIHDVFESNGKQNMYVEQVMERAQIKKASQMYEHGISMGQVADALGISIWDLMDYIGKTNIVDEFEFTTDIKEKLQYARSIFS